MNEPKLNMIAQESMNGERRLTKRAQAPSAKGCKWSIAVTFFIAIGIPGVPAVGQAFYRFAGPLVITAVMVGLAVGIIALVARKMWRLRGNRA